MLLLVLTSYLFAQGPRLRAWHNFFPLNLASFDRPRFSRFPNLKKVMKKVITHNFKTLQFTQQNSQCFVIFFSLFTFEFNHVLSFPGSACYYAEVLGFLVRGLAWLLAFFLFRPTE